MRNFPPTAIMKLRALLRFPFIFFFCLFAAQTALADSGSLQERAWKFLCENMPEQDRGKVPEAYLRENCRLALEVRDMPWSRDVPEEIFLNNVLPYSSVGEEVDAWRPLFREKFMPLAANCKTATEVAETLNREIWKMLGVIYSPKRDKPDQSPFHSMRIGIASCSGLSIILVNACRSVGVPARFAGCRWKKKPGNHSWVEFWDCGKWHHIGAFDSPKANDTWFDPDAAAAVEDDPVYAVYAASWAKTGILFKAVWRDNGDSRSPIPAYNVTARYVKKSVTSAEVSLGINLVDAAGKRVALPVRIIDKKTKRVLAEGVTHDDKQDLNNHFTVVAPAGTVVEIYVCPANNSREMLLGEHIFESASKTIRLSFPQKR